MDLAERNQAEDVLAFSDRADKQLPICSHDFAVVGIGKTQIEVGFSGFSGLVDGCSTADSGAESMNEPGKVLMLLSCPVRCAEDLRRGASPGWQGGSPARRAAVSLGRCHPRYIMSSRRAMDERRLRGAMDQESGGKSGGIPHLAKHERDVGHPSFVREREADPCVAGIWEVHGPAFRRARSRGRLGRGNQGFV